MAKHWQRHLRKTNHTKPSLSTCLSITQLRHRPPKLAPCKLRHRRYGDKEQRIRDRQQHQGHRCLHQNIPHVVIRPERLPLLALVHLPNKAQQRQRRAPPPPPPRPLTAAAAHTHRRRGHSFLQYQPHLLGGLGARGRSGTGLQSESCVTSKDWHGI